MDSDPQKYIQEISQFFNDQATIISYDTKKKEYIVNMNSINCVEFTIDDGKQQIVIKSIFRCAQNNETTIGSGKYIVERLVALSKSKQYALIVEYDVSRIVVPPEVMPNTTVPLRMLFVLSKGKSWYNSLGFYEKDYEENSRVIQQYLNTVINVRIDQNILKKVTELQLPTGKDTIANHFTIIFSNINQILKKWGVLVLQGQQNAIIPEEKTLMNYYIKLIHRKFDEMKKKHPHIYTKFNDLLYIDKGAVSSASKSGHSNPKIIDSPKKNKSVSKSMTRKPSKTTMKSMSKAKTARNKMISKMREL